MFDKIVRKLRLERGYTQQELGELVGVKKQTVTNWEAGNNFTDAETLKKLAKLFGVTVDELIGLDDELRSKADNIANAMKDRQSEKAVKLYRSMLDSGMTESEIENYINITIAITKKPPV